MPEVIPAFVRAEALETFAEERPERLDGSAAGRADDGFQLREAELDGIEIGAIRRQIHERRANALNRAADAGHFVDAEIVGDDEVAGLERRDQYLLDVGEEARAVDRAVAHPWRREPRDTERGDKRTRLPPATRRVVMHAGAADRATVAPEEVRGDARFVEKHQVRGVPPGGRGVPLDAREGDVRSIVFGRAHRFF